MTCKKKWLRRVLVAVACVLVVFCVGFGVYVSGYSHADSTATQAIEAGASSDAAVRVSDEKSLIAVGDSSAQCGLVLYPGGLVEPEAYVPLATKLAQRGIFCVIPKMPFYLAFFDLDAADSVIAAYPGVSHWWVGGHSLGGVAASSWAASNADKVEGLALLAAYSTKDLSALGIKVQIVYGSNDGVINRESLAKSASQIDAASVLEIAGGNHAGFGDYGEQDGDGEATISADEQQEIAADAIAAAILS